MMKRFSTILMLSALISASVTSELAARGGRGGGSVAEVACVVVAGWPDPLPAAAPR